jgi:hypothetical protein
MPASHYRPSGRFSPLALALVPLVILITIPFAWLYAWCALHLRDFLMPFAALGYALVLLLGCSIVGQSGKVRNPALMTVLSLAIGLAGWYVQWAEWAAMGGQAGMGAWEMLQRPLGLFKLVVAVKGGSAWSLISVTLEWLLLAIVPALLARSVAQQPFCEASKTWITEQKLERHFGPIADVPQFSVALDARPDDVMKLLPALRGDPPAYTKLSLFACAGAPDAWLSVWEVTRSVKDGKPSESRTALVDHLRIAPETARDVLALCEHDAIPGQDAPEELTAALDAMHAQHFTKALAAATPFCTAGEPGLRNDANRICALSASRLGQWRAAAGYWQALFAHESSSHNALQAATSLVMAGELAKGEQWFDNSLEISEEIADTALVHSYTNFISALQLSGNLKAALPYLEWLKQVYQGLTVTDPTFLTLRGVPFFISFLDKSAPTIEAAMDGAQARAWYSSMLPHIDQDGQDTLNAWLEQRAYG